MEFYRAFRHGKLHGRRVEWYPDGQPKEDMTYADGLLHGRFRERLKDGRAATTEWASGKVQFDRKTCNKRAFFYKVRETASPLSDPNGINNLFESPAQFLRIFGQPNSAYSSNRKVKDPHLFCPDDYDIMRHWKYECRDGSLPLLMGYVGSSPKSFFVVIENLRSTFN